MVDSRFYLKHVCDIIQTELGLEEGFVFLYNQKINKPTVDGLFVSVGVLTPRVFGSKSEFDNGIESQVLYMSSILSVDIMSRDTSALDRKEEVVMALGSNYAQGIQEKYSFKIGRLPTQFVNLSEIDGAAIPFRFNLSPQIQYSVRKSKAVDYYDDFGKSVIKTNA